MTWPTKIQWQRQILRQWQRHIHLENTIKEWPQRLVTYETFDQGEEETWLDQQKDLQSGIIETFGNTENFWHFWQLRTSIHCKFADLIISLIIFDKYKRGRYDLSETHIYNSDILYDCRLDKFDPNWKPLGSDISTSSPTNHKREKKTESCLKMFSEICPMFNFQTGCVCS